MPTTCEIKFENNPKKVMYTGQVLRGIVHLRLTNEKTVRGIFLKISGKAKVSWTEGAGKGKRTYDGIEKYLYEQRILVAGTDGDVCMAPGMYEYRFQNFLTQHLPSSMEGQYGSIRYKVSVIIEMPNLWPNKKFKTPFTVIQALDLNRDPLLRRPIVAQQDKTFSPCLIFRCFKSDPLEVVAQIPIGGYVPGQNISIELMIKNRSSQSVSKFAVQLVQHVTYYYSRDSISIIDPVIIVEALTGGCNKNQEEIHYATIQVPPVCPTDMSSSNLIKVQYYCRVIGSVGRYHRNPFVHVPIKLGTYPILNTGYNGLQPSRNGPPSYEEALRLRR